MSGAEPVAGRLRLGWLQYAWQGSTHATRQHVLQGLQAMAEANVQVACLPELHDAPYFCHIPRDQADESALAQACIPDDDPYLMQLASVALASAMVVLVPLMQPLKLQDSKGRPMYANRSLVIDADGSFCGKYTKLHIPEDPGYFEQQYFVPGSGGERIVFETSYGRIAPLICFDQWFPELARRAMLEDAALIVYATALGDLEDYPHEDENWRDAWMTVQRGHAIANGVHVAAVNRVGTEGPLRFFGNSFVADAFGNLRLHTGTGPGMAWTDLDLSMNQRIQQGWGFVAHRRPDAYGVLCAKVSDKAQ